MRVCVRVCVCVCVCVRARARACERAYVGCSGEEWGAERQKLEGITTKRSDQSWEEKNTSKRLKLITNRFSEDT